MIVADGREDPTDDLDYVSRMSDFIDPNRCGDGVVVAVARSASHTMAKGVATSIRLVAGLGVDGDAHAGETVRHRALARRDPAAPNLRQVHLIHAEVHDELAARGFSIAAGEMGENVTTRGLDLLRLPRATRLRIGGATIEVTGLRTPCAQLDAIAPGLMEATLERAADGHVVRKAGVMGIVVDGGAVRAGDPIEVRLPPAPWCRLEPV